MVRFIVLLILIIVLVVAYVRYIEKTSIFFPEVNLHATPEDFGLNYENVFFNSTSNTKLNGWYVPANEERYTVLFFHGNAGNMSDRLEKIAFLYALGLNVFIIDYRGYGRSQGTPSEEGLYQDAIGAYEYLLKNKNISPEKIIVYGVSLGSVPAIDLASKRKVGALIVDAAFTSAMDMARRMYPFIPNFLVSIKMDNVSKISQIRVPVLVVHSKDDEVTPVIMGQRLFEAASMPKAYLETAGGHNNALAVAKNELERGFKEFLDTLD